MEHEVLEQILERPPYDEPTPRYTSPYVWTDTLIDRTIGNLKSHRRSGCRNGARKPPLAASTCTGTSNPVSALLATTASWISSIGSNSPV